MNDVYRQLARKLDRLPNGFPATESGVELKILEKVFSPEDAAFALKLKALPEPARLVARRLRLDEEEVTRRLDGMAERGQIGSMIFRGERSYCVVPFVVGIFEFQLDRMDRELAELCEDYMPHLLGTLGGHEPALARVVPLSLTLEGSATILPHDDLRQMMEKARSFRVMDCICRKEKGLQDRPCSHTSETCLAFSRQENAYDDFPPWGRSVTREEALEVLAGAEREGLVHCTYNVQVEPMFVCNCCSCCCGFLRSITEYDAPHLLVRSNLIATVDGDGCLECGQVAEDGCPVAAVTAPDGACEVDPDRCIGCGVCTGACPSGAISLVERPALQQTLPPRDIVRWSVERATNRHGRLHGMAMRGWMGWEMARRKLAR